MVSKSGAHLNGSKVTALIRVVNGRHVVFLTNLPTISAKVPFATSDKYLLGGPTLFGDFIHKGDGLPDTGLNAIRKLSLVSEDLASVRAPNDKGKAFLLVVCLRID